MDQAPKYILRRIRIIFSTILVLGLGISGLVYHFANSIQSTTFKLVDTDIANFVHFQKLRFSLTEQERYLYEYYASFETKHYHLGYKSSHDETLSVLSELTNYFGVIIPLQEIVAYQKQIDEVALTLFNNVEQSQRLGGNTDWDLARTQLADISSFKRRAIDSVESLRTMTEQEVAASTSLVNRNLLKVNAFVIAYGIITFLIAYVVARSLRAYLGSAATSQRLSLFPKRTPNPIISLDKKNRITYCNPATRRLLKQLNLNIGHVDQLLATDLKDYQQWVLQQRKHFCRFEYQVQAIALECELHWLPDQKQWDVHLSDVSARKRAEEKIAFQAFHHPETCLANEYKFRDDLELECQLEKHFTLGLIEIRSFNQILSGYSLGQTQQLIKEIAAVLDLSCHEIARGVKLYHIGDKNFALYLPTADCLSILQELVSTIKHAVREQTFSSRHQVELDFGFACFPDHANSPDDLISNARMALNHSAASANSDYQLFDTALGNKLNRQRQLEAGMREGIANREFTLHFQAQLSLATNAIVGAELLVRWQHLNEWISPGEFIPLAERSGFIISLGNWILQEACYQGKELIEMGFSDMVIAVNISPKQFSQPDFVKQVQDALAKSGLAAHNLTLEITEGVFFNNESDSIESLYRLKKLGVKMAIDDFGTGYSSLSYLKQFPIDKLKIDQSFVRHLVEDDANRSIVRTIIDLGNNLGLTLIAEGVEEPEQQECLRNMGCDEIQGYWFSKPLDKASFVEFLQNKQSAA